MLTNDQLNDKRIELAKALGNGNTKLAAKIARQFPEVFVPYRDLGEELDTYLQGTEEDFRKAVYIILSGKALSNTNSGTGFEMNFSEIRFNLFGTMIDMNNMSKGFSAGQTNCDEAMAATILGMQEAVTPAEYAKNVIENDNWLKSVPRYKEMLDGTFPASEYVGSATATCMVGIFRAIAVTLKTIGMEGLIKIPDLERIRTDVGYAMENFQTIVGATRESAEFITGMEAGM